MSGVVDSFEWIVLREFPLRLRREWMGLPTRWIKIAAQGQERIANRFSV
jgi:hypothetical protein